MSRVGHKKFVSMIIQKTIYYHEAVMKIYDFPVFLLSCKFNVVDPTVNEISGLLMPQFTDNSIVDCWYNNSIFGLCQKIGT